MQLKIPPVIYGTSGLGNLFVETNEATKFSIIKQCILQSKDTSVFDSAGKYGAGLALEKLGICLKKLNVKQEDVIISNKLGWLRTKLKTEEPTFEPGVWKGLKHDAVQKISYDGIMECFEQGNELLNGYIPQMVSVHDPDEYLSGAKDKKHADKLYKDILRAYEALFHLKKQGIVQAVGIGAKDWRSIQRITGDLKLDWVMIANSLTVKDHPRELLDFVSILHKKKVRVINSAVFNSGFLIGSDYYNYRLVTPGTPANDSLLDWRKKFFRISEQFKISPAHICIQFALNIPGVTSVALSTTQAERVKENNKMAELKLPKILWDTLKIEGLISSEIT